MVEARLAGSDSVTVLDEESTNLSRTVTLAGPFL
jgi:hypothetical protein